MLTEKLKPIDCAQFMTAYRRIGIFDIELFYGLEGAFIRRIEEADGQTLVTMFIAHVSWAKEIVNQCLVKKSQDRRVYTYFKKYNEEYYEKLAIQLLRNINEINLKGILLVLAHGNQAHLKKRSNSRLIY